MIGKWTETLHEPPLRTRPSERARRRRPRGGISSRHPRQIRTLASERFLTDREIYLARVLSDAHPREPEVLISRREDSINESHIRALSSEKDETVAELFGMMFAENSLET